MLLCRIRCLSRPVCSACETMCRADEGTNMLLRCPRRDRVPRMRLYTSGPRSNANKAHVSEPSAQTLRRATEQTGRDPTPQTLRRATEQTGRDPTPPDPSSSKLSRPGGTPRIYSKYTTICRVSVHFAEKNRCIPYNFRYNKFVCGIRTNYAEHCRSTEPDEVPFTWMKGTPL